MDKIILIGAGGHARSCIDVIELSNQFEIAGFIDSYASNRKVDLKYPLIGEDKDLEKLRNKYQNVMIAIGQMKSSKIRSQMYSKLSNLNFTLPSIISPLAYVSKHSQIGEGTIVMHGAIINANAKIGKNCIINSQSLIEHDTFIGDNCHVSTGAKVNGEVSIGHGTFIGSGAIIKQCVVIGHECIIGAGTFVHKNISSNKLIKN